MKWQPRWLVAWLERPSIRFILDGAIDDHLNAALGHLLQQEAFPVLSAFSILHFQVALVHAGPVCCRCMPGNRASTYGAQFCWLPKFKARATVLSRMNVGHCNVLLHERRSLLL